MARVYMRRGRWAFDVRIAGKRYRKVVGTSRDEAERALRLFMEEQAGRQVLPTTKEPTVGELVDSYVRYVETHLRPASATAAHTARRPLQRLLGRIQADRLGIRNVEHYREKRLAEGVSRASVNREVGYLRAAFRRAVDAGELEKLPPRSAFKRLKIVRRRPEVFEPDEVARLLSAAEWRLRPAIALAYFAGLRLNEARTLTWSDVDEARGLVLVREKPGVFTPKDFEERAVPAPLQLLELLKEHRHRLLRARPADPVVQRQLMRASRFDPLWLSRAIRKAFVDAGLYDKARRPGLHALRRSYATRLAESGVGVSVLLELGGWSNLETAAHYIGAARAEAKAAAVRDAFER